LSHNDYLSSLSNQWAQLQNGKSDKQICFRGLAWFGFMVLNANFNNISAISWWSVLLVEETGVPGENHRPVASH
jgi:hypothetical protein